MKNNIKEQKAEWQFRGTDFIPIVGFFNYAKRNKGNGGLSNYDIRYLGLGAYLAIASTSAFVGTMMGLAGLEHMLK